MRFWIPAAVAATATVAAPLAAQTSHDLDPGIYHTPTAPVGQTLEYSKDSGVLPNAAEAATVIFAELVEISEAAWIRVYFGDVDLGPGSFVRITSLLDGEVQELGADAMAMWGNSTAYFNGDRVLVELVGGAATTANRLRIDKVDFEGLVAVPAGGAGQCGICGGDDRVPSSEEWAARLFPSGCTASVYNTDSCMVSAGHCVGGNMVVQFNVPNSNFNCSTNNPPVADQFPASAAPGSLNGGVGADWAVLDTGTNNLGEKPYDRYGVLRPIAAAPAPNGAAVEVWGYGVDQTCTLSQTQQHSIGTICSVGANLYTFNVDITGGNSGSALMRNGEIIGIVTHCPCCNVATRVDRADFTTARDFCPAPDPTPLATGNNSTADGYLLIAPDAYGAWAPPFSGGTGTTTDRYNPVGSGTAQVAAFTSGLYLFIGNSARTLLSTSGDWQGVMSSGSNLTVEITQEVVASDSSGNGTDDTGVSAFQVSGGGVGAALSFDLVQTVESLGLGPIQGALLTQEYTITNLDNDPIDFTLVRAFDGDLLWNGDFSNDNVGTGTNGSTDERYVYQSEAGSTVTAITLSSPQGDAYSGGKHGVDPDGGGGSPAYNFGTDVQVWEAFGIPSGWRNNIAGVGYDADGDSGAAPGGSTDPRDAFMHLDIPVSLGAGASTTVVVHHTYGHNAPLIPEEPCPWDCVGDDGVIGIDEFLAVLGSWGDVGAPCDFDGDGVGITDFLKVLGLWGSCP